MIEWKHLRFLRLIIQLLIFLFCVVYIIYGYLAYITPDKSIHQDFQRTTCFLTSKKLTSKGFFVRKHRADFLITYTVNGVQYNRWVSGNGLDATFWRDQAKQEDLLTQYEVGRTYPCWYDANNPQTSILVPRHDWVSIYPLMIPAIIGVIALYFVLTNLFQYRNLLTKDGIAKDKKKAKKITKRKTK